MNRSSLVRRFAATTLALSGIALLAGAQGASSNLNTPATPFAGHQLTGKAASLERLQIAREATASQAYRDLDQVVIPADVQQLNTGGRAQVVFEGHDLTTTKAAVSKILYCPSEADDAAYRAAISAATGGATVDYFDTRVATPSVATLLQYDAVYTWANFAYSDNIGLGNNLASYNDQGGTVILGSFCTYTSGNFLSGTIMTAGYSPVVSPSGTNHFSSSTYTSGGVTCIYNGVTSLTCTFRDILTTQGTGVIDGLYPDGEICHAYRGTSGAAQGEVIYSNGSGAVQLSGTGDWGLAVGNAAGCNLAGTSILYAPSEADDPAFRAAISAAAGGATVDYFDARVATPSVAQLQAYTGVQVWANFAFADAVGYGNNLATYVDGGGDVVLGAFCTYTSGSALSGAIMTSAYSPVVSPTGSNHFSFSTDAGPFYSCITSNVSSLGATYRDILALQGSAILDSRFDSDNELATIYRVNPGGGAGDVIYLNGAGGTPLGTTGDWAQAVADSILCDVGSVGATPSCVVRTGVLGLNPNDTACVNNPIVGQTWTVSISTTPLVGTGTSATVVAVGFGGPTSGIPALGYELLVLPPAVLSTALGTHNIPVPPYADFIGQDLYIQGGRLETGPGTIVLTNAIDVIVGL